MIVLAIALLAAGLIVFLVARRRPKQPKQPAARQDLLRFASETATFGPASSGPGTIVSYRGVDYVVRAGYLSAGNLNTSVPSVVCCDITTDDDHAMGQSGKSRGKHARRRRAGRAEGFAVAVWLGLTVAAAPGVAVAEPDTEPGTADAPAAQEPADKPEPADIATQVGGAADVGDDPETELAAESAGGSDEDTDLEPAKEDLDPELEVTAEAEQPETPDIRMAEETATPAGAREGSETSITAANGNEPPIAITVSQRDDTEPAVIKDDELSVTALITPSTSRTTAPEPAAGPAAATLSMTALTPTPTTAVAVDPSPLHIAVASLALAFFEALTNLIPFDPFVQLITVVFINRLNDYIDNETPTLSVPTLSGPPVPTDDGLMAITGSIVGADGDGDELVFAISAQGTHGTATIDASGHFTYLFSPVSYSGTDTFIVAVSDGTSSHAHASGPSGHIVTREVTITIPSSSTALTNADPSVIGIRSGTTQSLTVSPDSAVLVQIVARGDGEDRQTTVILVDSATDTVRTEVDLYPGLQVVAISAFDDAGDAVDVTVGRAVFDEAVGGYTVTYHRARIAMATGTVSYTDLESSPHVPITSADGSFRVEQLDATTLAITDIRTGVTTNHASPTGVAPSAVSNNGRYVAFGGTTTARILDTVTGALSSHEPLDQARLRGPVVFDHQSRYAYLVTQFGNLTGITSVDLAAGGTAGYAYLGGSTPVDGALVFDPSNRGYLTTVDMARKTTYVSLFDNTNGLHSTSAVPGLASNGVVIADPRHLYVATDIDHYDFAVQGQSMLSILTSITLRTPPVTNTTPSDLVTTDSVPDPDTGFVAGQASATDLDDTLLVYRVDPVDGPSLGDLHLDALTGEWTYQPTADARHDATAPNRPTADTFTLTATDIHGTTTTLTISVDIVPQNEAPTLDISGPSAADADGWITYTTDFSDPDGDEPVYTLLYEPYGTETEITDGFLRFRPNPANTEMVAFTLLASDGHGGIAQVQGEIPATLTAEMFAAGTVLLDTATGATTRLDGLTSPQRALQR